MVKLVGKEINFVANDLKVIGLYVPAGAFLDFL